MEMETVIRIFGTKANIARSIGITKQALNNWSDTLSPTASDRVIAACVRKGIDPTPLLEMEEGTGGDDERD